MVSWLFLVVVLTSPLCFAGGGGTPLGDTEWTNGYPVIKSEGMPAPQVSGDIIPDFSRVGYRWGDVEMPMVEEVTRLTPPTNGGDATAMIQSAIDNSPRGAIVLSEGVYNVYGELTIDRSGIVLRGEGEGKTTIVAAGKRERKQLITIGGYSHRNVDRRTETDIIDKYVPCGQFWVRVRNTKHYSVGDDVVVYRPSTERWIYDLKMDQIGDRPDGLPVKQWRAGEFDIYSERVITRIEGDTLFFENPIVMSLDKKYGGGEIYKYSYADRIEECGVEGISFEAEYSSAAIEESYARAAIVFTAAQHCWVRDVNSKYFGFGLVLMDDYSKNITVENCAVAEPKSRVKGGNRYSFYINKGQLCLVRRCSSDSARHDYATGPCGAGPNVFTDCVATNTLADIGPHHRWNCGTLYDVIRSDGAINIQDRSNLGSGQGWAGANNVIWNSVGLKIMVQSPWVSAYNYSIGNIGTKMEGSFKGRPDGVWISEGAAVEPYSLYEAQLQLRRNK